MNLRIGCSPAYVFSHFQDDLSFEKLERAIRRVAELDFCGLQLETYESSQAALYTEANIATIRDLYEKFNLESWQFVAHSVKNAIYSLDSADQEEGLTELRVLTGICRKLGIIHTITIPSAPPRQMIHASHEVYPGTVAATLGVPEGWEWDRIWKDHIGVQRRCLDIVGEAGFRLAVEPIPYSLISNTDSLLRVAAELNSDQFGMNLDTGHMFAQKESLPVTIEKLGPRLFGTHISDNDGVIHDHWKIGTGKIAWADVIAALRKVNYKGPLDIEINVVENPDEAYIESRRYLQALM